MPSASRPQAPGYLANLMARLFHEVSAEGLTPLGIAPEHFPILVELWFGDRPVTRASLSVSQEAGPDFIDPLVRAMADAGLIVAYPADANEGLALTDKAKVTRDAAIASARRANDAARNELNEEELGQLMALMNRVIEALKKAKS